MKTILHLDTSDNKKTRVGVVLDGKENFIEVESSTWKSQAVLPLIQKLLKKHGLNIADIEAIEVKEGPGSFTGLRVGAAIANTLGTWLRIPVNNRKIGEIVEPIYQ